MFFSLIAKLNSIVKIVKLINQESHRAHADFDHRLKNAHRHEQELQKQIHSLQSELKIAKTEINETSGLKSEFNKVQAELMKLKSDLSLSQNEAKSEAVEITTLRATITEQQEQINYYQAESAKLSGELRMEKSEISRIRTELGKVQEDLKKQRGENVEISEQLNNATGKVTKLEVELSSSDIAKSGFAAMQNGDRKSIEMQMKIARLEEDRDRLLAQVIYTY